MFVVLIEKIDRDRHLHCVDKVR
ncbi:uncharacterized protein METZ01_LOCUS179251 [marine metagenome]|uniref:Uncharacterized protein n=1 Tax=marine metagenome TaxID=408172 RepID=A0A382CM71_9ZZZZ